MFPFVVIIQIKFTGYNLSHSHGTPNNYGTNIKIYKKLNSINLDKSLRELDVNSKKREIMKLLDIGETVYYNRLKLIKDFLKNKNYKQILLGNLEIKI